MSKIVTVIVQAGQMANMSKFDFLKGLADVEVRYLDECVIKSDTGLMRNRQMETMGPDSFTYTPEYIAALAESNIIITAMAPVPTAAFQKGNVEAVCILRSGADNVDAIGAATAGVKVINVPGRLRVPVSEFTIGMVIAEMKNIGRGHANLVEGKWVNRYPNRDYYPNLRGSNVGIIGFGAIGTRDAKVFQAFEANVLIHDPFVKEEAIRAMGYTPLSLNELCAQADVICIHVPLSEKTRGLVGEEQIRLMKHSVCLVNTARAELIDQNALLTALKEHRIGGAALDVYEDEPIDATSPYVGLDNVTLTPHLAGYCSDSFNLAFDIMSECLRDYFKTGTWTNVVRR